MKIELFKVCDFQPGKKINNEENGKNPVFNDEGIIVSNTKQEPSFQGKTLVFSKIFKNKDPLVIDNTGFHIDESVVAIYSKNTDKLRNEYLWIYLNSISDQVNECYTGNAIRTLDLNKLRTLKIKLPNPPIQDTIIVNSDLLKTTIENFQTNLEHLKDNYKNYLNSIV